MDKNNKRFNRRARQTNPKKLKEEKESDLKERSDHKNIIDKIEINFDQTKYDSCNSLVLDKSSKTSKKDILHKTKVKSRVLSKKQKKKLEKVLHRKNRKINVNFCFIIIFLRFNQFFHYY